MWGWKVMKLRRSLGATASALLSLVFLAGCTNQPEDEGLSTFSSMDQAYAAVDEVLQCESDPVGDPIVPVGNSGKLTTEQRLCSEHVQVDLYPDEAALQTSFEILVNSHQGEVHLVRGANWIVVDVTDVATGEPTTWDIQRLAEELNGRYTTAGT
ncbi:hypothetical protein GCM10027404_32880 [Arthrobacter tumbae]